MRVKVNRQRIVEVEEEWTVRGVMKCSLAGRRRRGMPCRCGSCREEIEGDAAYIGFFVGQPNLLLCPGCAPLEDRKRAVEMTGPKAVA